MRPIVYWRLTLLLPLVLPFVALALMWSLGHVGTHVPLPIVQGLAIAWLSLYVAGIPYALFATALFVALRGRRLSTYKWCAACAPILFLPVLAACAAILAIFAKGDPSQVLNAEMRGIYGVAFVVGYCYVALAMAVEFTLHRLGLIDAKLSVNTTNTNDRGAVVIN